MNLTGLINMFPGYDRIYCINYELDERKMCFANIEDGTPHMELLRGDWVPDRTLQVHWGMGRAEPGDIAVGQTVAWYYLSERVQQFFLEHDLTGWVTYPIILHNKAGEVCPGYAGLSITGRCGPIQEERSQPIPKHLKKPGMGDRMGLYFDESSWDGSDFFCPEGENMWMFATERVKNLFEEYMIKGFEFTPLTEATFYS